MEVAASTTPTRCWWGRHSTPPSFPRKTSFLRLHPRFPNFAGLGAACGSRRSSEVNVSPWDDKPFEMLPNGKRVYFDEQDVVTFLDPPNELVPLDPSSYNPAAYLWKKIEDIPEERRHRLLLLLKPRLVSIAWQIAGSRYEDSKLVKKSASQLFANSNKDDVMLEYYNCRTTGGPMPLSWINSYRKAIFSCTDGKAYGRLIGGSILAPFADSFAPLYFALRDIKEVMPTEQPCDLAYEFGDGLFDVKEFPQGFPKPVVPFQRSTCYIYPSYRSRGLYRASMARGNKDRASAEKIMQRNFNGEGLQIIVRSLNELFVIQFVYLPSDSNVRMSQRHA